MNVLRIVEITFNALIVALNAKKFTFLEMKFVLRRWYKNKWCLEISKLIVVLSISMAIKGIAIRFKFL